MTRPAGPGAPGTKAMTFGPSVKRLVGRLAPERAVLAVILFLAVASVVLTVVAPSVLGRATDLIFDGIVAVSYTHLTLPTICSV